MPADVQTSRLAPSVDDLLRGAERREHFVNPDGRSIAPFERVWIDGRPHIVKHLHVDHDFISRVSGDVRPRAVRAWDYGLLDAAPDLVDHAVVGAALGEGRNGWGGALLMRDVSQELLPQGDVLISPDDHAAYVDHVTGFCAATWGWTDDLADSRGLLGYDARWTWFSHAAVETERQLGWPERVPQIADEGWVRFAERAPRSLAALVDELRHDIAPLASALKATPSCLLHGDVKASNVGRAADGRTILLDWNYVGEGPVCHELVWHVALDRSRLPTSKEGVIDAFRAALTRHGIDTDPWWDRQLRLCLLGGVLQFGWEKALGDDDEFDWWCDAGADGARLL